MAGKVGLERQRSTGLLWPGVPWAGSKVRVVNIDKELVERAREAAETAYAPYSGFRVGAAVRSEGQVYTGCNVENASYGLSICAERVAIFTAIAAGATRIEGLALACIDAGSSAGQSEQVPCGACRQVMAEFARPDLPISLSMGRALTLTELLPDPFSLKR